MYLSFYNLKVKPFQMSTDPDFLWLGEQHKEALETLKYAIRENKGILALTGEVGTGKTTLINALIQSLEDDKVGATIYDPSFDVLEFFNVVAEAFGLDRTFESKGQFINHFRQFLLKAHKREQKVLLIIDEAQGINSEVLEELRLLSNLEKEHNRLLNIFFVGQNEFINILQEYKNRALRQRIAVRYHLEPLKLSETDAYVRHRLRVSGTEAAIFTLDAIDEIFDFSGGYPRLINIICDHALLRGYVKETNTIHADTIRECRKELLDSKQSPKYPVHDPEITSPEALAVDSGILGQDWRFSDQRQRFSGRDTKGVPLESDPEPVKRRKMPTFVVVVLVAAIGAIAGYVYLQDGTNSAKLRIFSVTKPKDVPRSMKAPPLDNKPMIPASIPERSEITDNAQDKTVKDSRFSIVRPLEPESAKKIAPTKGEPLDALPLNRFEEKPHSPSASKQTGVPVVSAPGSGTRETGKAQTPTQVKTSGWGAPDPNKKTLVSASTPVPPPSQQKISETAQQDYGKQIQTPDLGETTAKSGWKQNDTSGKNSTTAKNLTVEGVPSAGSSVLSKKPGTGSGSSFVKPPAQTAAVKEEPTVGYQMVTQEKEQSAVMMPEEKNSAVQNDGRVVSLKQPVGEPEAGSNRTFEINNFQDRLKTFLNNYCRTYEGKNLDRFGAFFAPDALEQGKPFKSWAPQYRQNFNKIDSMIYNIELERFATHDETGEVRIEGTFQVRAKLRGSEKWRRSSGRISMVLEPYKDSFRVKKLNY